MKIKIIVMLVELLVVAVSAESSIEQTRQTTKPATLLLRTNFVIYRSVTDHPDKRPSFSAIRSVLSDDADWLLERYRSESALTNRYATLFALGMTGDPRAFELIRHTLLEEFNGKELDDREINAMIRHAEVMGLLARKNPVALDFITNHMFAEDWRYGTSRKWKAVCDTEENTQRRMSKAVLRSLALAGNQVGLEILSKLRSLPPQQVQDLTSSMVGVAFAHFYIEEHGVEAYDRLYFGTGTFQEFARWRTETEEGRAWGDWAEEIKQLNDQAVRP